MNIAEARLSDFEKIFPALHELRPHLTLDSAKKQFEQLIAEGYRLAYINDENQAPALIGFRIVNFFYSGKTLYIDDLSTLPDHRKKGYAKQLFEWVKKTAKTEGCDHLSLDSGFTRKDAHRFYLNQGLALESFHFGQSVAQL